MCSQLSRKFFSVHTCVLKIYVPYSLLYYKGGTLLSVHLSIYLTFSKLPVDTQPNSFILHRSMHSSFPHSCLTRSKLFLSFFSLFDCLWISLIAFFIIWHISFKSLAFLSNQMYPKLVLYSSSFELITQYSHFGYPNSHS